MSAIDRRIGVFGAAAIKVPCRVATTASITLDGLQTIDGVALAAGDRVLVTFQTDARDNGIYVADSGEWQRALDFNGPRDVVQGTLVLVVAGTSYGSTVWRLTTASPIIGASTLSFAIGGSPFFETRTIPTLAALKQLPDRPTSVITLGRLTPGDGGHGEWTFRSGNQSANITLDPLSGIWAAPASDSTGASGAWQRLFDGDLYNGWYGATEEATADVSTPALQAAINAAVEIGVDLVVIGQIKISDEIFHPGTVLLKGRGSGNIFQPVSAAPSALLWYGAPGDYMIKFGWQDDLVARGGICDLQLNGRAIAGSCLSIKDHQSGRFDGLLLTGATVSGLHLTNSADMSDPTGDSSFRDLRIMLRGGSTDSAIGIHFDGVVAPGAGGVTLCTFIKPRIEHADGAAIAVGPRADGMRFIAPHTFRDNTETGIGIWAYSTDTDQIISGWEVIAGVITGGVRVDYPDAARAWKLSLVNDVDVNSGLPVGDGLYVYGAGSPAVDADAGYVGFLYGPARVHSFRETIRHDAFAFMRWDSTNELLHTTQGTWKTGGSTTRFYNDAALVTGAVEMLTNNVSGNEAWVRAGNAFTSGVALLTHYPVVGCTWSPSTADTYTARVGLFGDFGNPPNNGCYIQVDGAFYQLVCAAGGTRTTVTTTIPRAVAKIQWRIETTNVSVNFHARTGANRDFGLVASITTNLPSALLCFGAHIITNENNYKGVYLTDFKFSYRTRD